MLFFLLRINFFQTKKKTKNNWELTGLIATVWVTASFVFVLIVSYARNHTAKRVLWTCLFPGPKGNRLIKKFALLCTQPIRLHRQLHVEWLRLPSRDTYSPASEQQCPTKTAIKFCQNDNRTYAFCWRMRAPLQIFWKIGFEPLLQAIENSGAALYAAHSTCLHRALHTHHGRAPHLHTPFTPRWPIVYPFRIKYMQTVCAALVKLPLTNALVILICKETHAITDKQNLASNDLWIESTEYGIDWKKITMEGCRFNFCYSLILIIK